ncbi:hypothetical protein [Paenibacillus sp. y28]|uniref:hypothetical protein n=1 Tax=Paenibacillus sp. y28 TaxID=3129110 RepID=UPI00301B078B
MRSKFYKTIVSLTLSASLLSVGAYSALAEEAGSAVSIQAEQVYSLTEVLDVQVKSVINEPVLKGTRIGVVVNLKNNSDSVTRVPDYELRVKTADGVVYTLQPSTSNLKAIQPHTESELSYLSVIDRKGNVVLAELNWTDVDMYIYPKKETVVLNAPITLQPWQGRDTQITDPKALLKWSDSFTLPYFESPITYTPTDIHKESTDTGTVYVVQLLAYNPGDQREIVPTFLIDGKTAEKVYAGSRVEADSLVLESKEQKYIHYAIPADQDAVLSSLNVLTTEYFGSSSGAAGQYAIGRYNILIPSGEDRAVTGVYALGDAMQFDSRSQLIHPNLKVSMVEFNISDNEEEGNKNITAKFAIQNNSDRPLDVPVFQTSLLSSDGYDYSGKRQASTPSRVLPKSSVIVNYAFTMPVSETGENLQLKIQDAVSAAPYKSTIAAYGVKLQESTGPWDSFNMYPFVVKFSSWDISFLYNSGTQQFSYKGKFFLDVERKVQTELDANFPKLQFELYDAAGRLVGTASKPMIGQDRLLTGENNLTFTGTSEQFTSPLTLKVYETFTTASGESKRLVAELED